jgi:ribulose-phosphate 3-epimerase
MNPGTPESMVEPVLELVDLILVMSVNPGFGGQKFIPGALEKVRNLRQLVGMRPIDIEIDGGVTAEIAPQVAHAGANILVAGSAVFKDGRPETYRANIAAIRDAAVLARGEAA